MFKLSSSTLAGVATLALAAVPALALTTSAHAEPVVVKVSDLDVGSAEGARTLDQRVTTAAREFCTIPANQGGLTARANCMRSVRAEVQDNLMARDSMYAKTQSTELARR